MTRYILLFKGVEKDYIQEHFKMNWLFEATSQLS